MLSDYTLSLACSISLRAGFAFTAVDQNGHILGSQFGMTGFEKHRSSYLINQHSEKIAYLYCSCEPIIENCNTKMLLDMITRSNCEQLHIAHKLPDYLRDPIFRDWSSSYSGQISFFPQSRPHAKGLVSGALSLKLRGRPWTIGISVWQGNFDANTISLMQSSFGFIESALKPLAESSAIFYTFNQADILYFSPCFNIMNDVIERNEIASISSLQKLQKYTGSKQKAVVSLFTDIDFLFTCIKNKLIDEAIVLALPKSNDLAVISELSAFVDRVGNWHLNYQKTVTQGLIVHLQSKP